MDEKQNKLISQYVSEIINIDSINLTRITDTEDAKLRHIEDSLAVVDDINNAPEGLYGDLGSGGGFPGVPLGIASQRETILIDSVKKKMNVVQSILDRLNISNQIKTYGGRIEELALERPNEFSVLTARALTSLPSLLELASPLLKLNGWLIALKSHIDEEELQQTLDIEEKTGMRLISSREYNLSDQETFRSVYIFEKYKDPSIQLPRRIGLAQKRPLKA